MASFNQALLACKTASAALLATSSPLNPSFLISSKFLNNAVQELDQSFSHHTRRYFAMVQKSYNMIKKTNESHFRDRLSNAKDGRNNISTQSIFHSGGNASLPTLAPS